ncbi:MAG: ABC transporter ATP-binding protein [Spirochaetaceae bacterium]|nr:ABC transporter ATP-binding protein [Spirochaetaceae bacterium]
MAAQSVPVKLENVSKTFRDPKTKAEVHAVQNANFEIQPGELVTLLGPSGCGKTTTLRMIGGFELPTQGKIFIGGNDVTYLPPNGRETATVFQSYGLFPHMSVEENVAYGLKIRKLPKEEIEARVKKTLELVGLLDLAKRSPGRLSGGQQQRVALARSLVVEPQVLLLDEPLSNLDALLREQMRIEIRRIQKSLGITAIYVTHDRIEAMSLSDRVIVMKDGIIRQIGTPNDIYEKPNSVFVAGFVGKVAFFPVSLDAFNPEGSFRCTLAGRRLNAGSKADDIAIGGTAVLMARPESLSLLPPGEGYADGTVSARVYLGSSVEVYVKTQYGEILVQVDDPAGKKIAGEGEAVSIDFDERLVRILPESKEEKQS